MLAFLAGSGIALGQPTAPARDVISDGVGATFAEFRVDEAGQATYRIPLYTPPGTAGVQPSLALQYSSEGGNGPLGKGWTISGMSAITPCRRTREHGDFVAGGVPVDGNPRPVQYNASDAFCLDGQRLLLVNAGPYGASNAEYRLEFDPFTRIHSFGGNNGAPPSYTGPGWFRVQRKDGSTSEYGNTVDSRIENTPCDSNCSAFPAAAWALNRTEDSTGNYILYSYIKTGFAYGALGRQIDYQLASVRWTGKRNLPGQSGPESTPYAGIYFSYQPIVTPNGWEKEIGYQGGKAHTLSQYLASIEVKDQINFPFPRILRYYGLQYEQSTSGSNYRLLRSLTECRDSGLQTCYRPTVFRWSDQDGVRYSFDTQDPFGGSGSNARVGTYRLGDVDGDGRTDVVWFRRDDPACPGGNRLRVGFGGRIESGGVSRLTLDTPDHANFCTALNAGNNALATGVALFDFNGDGLDDLAIADPTSQPDGKWHIYPSLGRPAPGGPVFDFSNDIMIVVIPTASSQEQMQFGDFNGDGLIDILYPNGSNGLSIRFSTRKSLPALGYEFGPSYAVTNFLPAECQGAGISCNLELFGQTTAGFGVASDFDGDGRADVVLRIVISSALAAGVPLPPLTFHPTDSLAEVHPDFARGFQFQTFYAFRMDAKTESAQTQALAQYGGRLYTRNDLGPQDPRNFQFADFNGDGLADLFYTADANAETFRFALSTGTTFEGPPGNVQTADIREIKNREHLQLADINGDGRVEILYPTDTSSPCPGSTGADRVFRFRRYQSDLGGFDNAHLNAQCIVGGGARAGDLTDAKFLFGDFDGDGAHDYIKLRDQTGSSGGQSRPTLFSSRASASARFKRRDAISRITNGNGAVTAITYQPHTNKAIYRRLKDSRNTLNEGRGSPVLDLLGTTYVVSEVSSSSPTRTDTDAASTIWYRYAGGRAQAGGRGLLGYMEIVTLDVNRVQDQHTATQQLYRQDYPFIGASAQTGKFVLGGPASPPTRGSADLDACASNPEAPGRNCFYNPKSASDNQHPVFGTPPPNTLSLGGALVQASASLWSCQGTGGSALCDPPPPVDSCPASGESQFIDGLPILVHMGGGVGVFSPSRGAAAAPQQPIFPFVPRTLDLDFALDSGAITRHVCGLFAYGDSYGNATSTAVTTFSGGQLATEIADKRTLNVFLNDSINWRLGRLLTSQVDDERAGVVATRITDFRYDVDSPGIPSAADTGLLIAEHLQKDISDTQELRTLYTLDRFGNRTEAFTCSKRSADGSVLTDINCRAKSLVQQRPGSAALPPSTSVHRYALHTFDSLGRYQTQTRVPFFSATLPNNVNELATLTIQTRDEFGHSVQETDANGRVTVALYGALGRPYFSADSSGSAVVETFRWCGQGSNEVGCPVGQAFRKQVSKAGSPTTFVYFDRLGRESLSVTQAFESVQPGRQWRAACHAYDRHGRSESSTVPFFLGSIHGSGSEPAFLPTANPCWPAGGPARSVTEYDVLGRVRQAAAPDGSVSTITYTGRETKSVDARGREERQTTNALGEVVSVEQGDAVSGAVGVGGALLVSHHYDSQGNLRFVRRNAGSGEIVSEQQFDGLGRIVATIDPDRGLQSIQYNAAGEVLVTLNARGDRVEQHWDALGRIWRRRSGPQTAFDAPESALGGGLTVDEWRFDTASNGRGQIDLVSRAQASGGFARSHTYDSIGRPASRTTQFDAATFVESNSYDSFGRVLTETDASGDTTTHGYTARGYMVSQTYSLAGVGTFYEVLEQDAWGNVTKAKRGGNITTDMTFHPTRGWIDTVMTSNQFGSLLQNWDFDFDVNGNLTRRSRAGGVLVEDVVVDKLGRLEQVVRSGSGPAPLTTQTTYDRLGNICSSGPVGALRTYTYPGRSGCPGAGGSASARPHAVGAVGGIGYVYDGIGQVTNVDEPGTAADRFFSYDALEQATSVKKGSVSSPASEVQFAYGPEQSRYRRVDRVSGSVTRTTRYVGRVESILVPGGVETKRYLAGDAIITTRTLDRNNELRFALPDHLGSIDVVVAVNGSVVESTSFDAWGGRRSPTTGISIRGALSTTTRGFTGHEHADALGVIHMNGRIYDPDLARFLQADRMIDSGIQGLNRYSYVLNNPLSLTDPTGHLSTRQWGQLFVTAVMAIGTYGASLSFETGMKGMFSAMGTTGNVIYSAGMGSVAGMTASQSIKGAGWGAFSGLAFWGIGSYFQSAAWAQGGNAMGSGLNLGGHAAKTLAHGIAGGIMSDLQGGKFGSGFAAAGVTQAVSGSVDLIDPSNPAVGVAARVSAAAIIGGVVSDITGGKFANGALTGAFSRAFNHELEEGTRDALSLRVTARLKGILDAGIQIEDGEALSFLTLRGDSQFSLMVNETGAGQLQIGSVLYTVNDKRLVDGSGLSIAGLTLSGRVTNNGVLQFSGSFRVPVSIFGVQFRFTRNIDIESGTLSNSGLLGRAARGLKYGTRELDHSICQQSGGDDC